MVEERQHISKDVMAFLENKVNMKGPYLVAVYPNLHKL